MVLALFVAMIVLPGAALSAQNLTVSLDKANYAVQEEMEVIVGGITREIIDRGSWLGVYEAGGAHEEYLSWQWLRLGVPDYGFFAPSAPGAYEVRLYTDSPDYSDEALVVSVPFSVGEADKQGSISLASDAFLAGDAIPVTVKGISETMERTGAWIGVFRRGSGRAGEYVGWVYVTAGDSVAQLRAPNEDGEFEVRLYAVRSAQPGQTSVMSVPFTVSGAVEQPVSDWAVPEVAKAEHLGLIPDVLQGVDLTGPITRLEFAAVSVKVYENLSGETAGPAGTNPFKDTAHPEVLKAYNVGITDGVAADAFGPDQLLTREQAATMLTRVFKKAFVEGWTLEDDDKFAFDYAAPPAFADHEKISDWARASVYFMAANGIIEGIGDNVFAPRATTAAEHAANYAVATREQSLAIAVRMAENLDADDASVIIPARP